MLLRSVALTHRTAPLAVRERVNLSPERQVEVLRSWGAQVAEIALLVTCHRTELYWVDRQDDTQRGWRWLAGVSGLSPETLQAAGLMLEGAEVVRHLFRVAAGLDSRVIGETQILGQVRRARELARTAGTLGPSLDRLFALSLAVGRAVRARGSLARARRSLARVAARLALEYLDGMPDSAILVLGAGEMGQEAISELACLGVAPLFVSNRTSERLAHLAVRYRVQVVDWDAWPSLLGDTTVVIVATGAPEPVLRAEQIPAETRLRLVIDLGLPRNVDPGVGQRGGVELRTVDDLADTSLAGRDGSGLAVAEALIAEGTARYLRWYRARTMGPEIRAVQERLESLCAREVRRAFARAKHQDVDEVATAAARSMVRKILAPLFDLLEHEPAVVRDALRALADDGAIVNPS